MNGISVIVPTHNRPGPLERCLQALSAMEQQGLTLEVIIVNDGGSPLDARRLEALLPGLVIIEQGNTGPAGARNAGIAAAGHPHLAFTDDDCLPEPGWIHDLQAALLEQPSALIGGHTINLLRHNPFSEASQLVVEAVCRWQNGDPSNGRFIPSNNMACRREQILALGGFNTAFPLAAGEDRDFCDRWREAGWPIVQLQDRARLGHCHWLDHRSYWRQQMNYGRGGRTLHHLRRANGLPSEKAGFGFLVLLLAMALRRDERGRWQPLLTLLVLESQVAILVGNLRQRRCWRTAA
ncbi:MAG: glycosyltransferase family 2 protein [Prochlorococcaceae cyanobacterium]